ncbi:MAG: efflux RND transporter periplasmic adaptor subunit [Coprobacter sp.]|nr:efflux RND transporter periplasmic adaptor subunit [Coprobacter sp.]
MLWAIVCVLTACHHRPQNETEVLRNVKVTRPQPISGETFKYFSGIVKEAQEIKLGFKTAGQIERIYVKEGDYVRTGQKIAQLDTKDYQLGVEAAQIQYDQLKDEVARMKQLYDSKSITGNDYEKATSGLKQLEIQLQNNKNKLEYTTLVAPVSGYVQRVDFETAEMVNAGTPVITLLDVSHLEVEFYIPASLYPQQNSFSEFACHTSYAPLSEYDMKLISITPKADGNQLYKVRLQFAQPTEKTLTAGMNVEVNFKISNLEKKSGSTFTVPLHAVFSNGSQSYVWILDENSQVIKQEITTDGIDSEGDIIVISGLTGSEQIVKAGVNALHENEKVNVIEEAAETNVGGLL